MDLDFEAEAGPRDASQLNHRQVKDELEKRGEKSSNFMSDDIKMLQRHFDREWDAEKEDRDRKLHAAAARKAEEEAELRKRRLLERQRAEEEDAVNTDPRIKFWIELIEENATPPDAVMRAHPVALRAFVKALELNHSLTTLDLCRCSLADDVGIGLAKVLKVNKTLVKVDLDDNRLGPKTALALGEALVGNVGLRSLSLEENPLTHDKDYEGLAAMARMLQSNATLTHLNLWKCGVGDQGGQALAAAMPANNSLISLQLSPADGLKYSSLETIAQCLEENMKIYEVEQREEAAAAEARRQMAAESKRQADEEAAKQAEEEWLEAQAQARAKARAEAAIMAKKQEIEDKLAREEAEKKRREDKARAEAAEKGKKKKKGKKGKKKK